MSPTLADSSKLIEYDEHYLKELTEEKESLAKNGKDNSHALRLLEAGQSNRWDPTRAMYFVP